MEKHFPKLSDLLTPSSILCANVYASSTEFEKVSNIRIELHKSAKKKKNWSIMDYSQWQISRKFRIRIVFFTDNMK